MKGSLKSVEGYQVHWAEPLSRHANQLKKNKTRKGVDTQKKQFYYSDKKFSALTTKEFGVKDAVLILGY